MPTASIAGLMGMFGDQVYSSTDLNRRSGEVLDHARKGPVTISRNKEQFALLRREQVAELVKAALQFGPTLELIEGVLTVVEGKEPPASLVWLKSLETDDLRKLTREVLAASMSALRETNDWEAVSAVVHEWHESALVAMSGVLDEAMKSTADESPLTDPRSILAESEGASTTER